jgi:RNA polymerase sigma-70 factor (ECF subfamily)
VERDWLVSAFLTRLPERFRDPANHPNLGTELVELVASARNEVPSVQIDPGAFVGYVAERVTFDAHGRPLVQGLRAGALCIAAGCVAGEAAALAEFERIYAPEIVAALARNFDRALADEAALRLRERLFLVEPDEVPRLSSYSGRGDLRAWLRAAAARTAIDLMRARRTVPVEQAVLDEAVVDVDPLLAALKQHYREEFREAFRHATEALTDRERTLLRYRFRDGLSLDELAALFRVHRATAARWLASIRETLFEATRSRLVAQLEVTDSEVDSVLRLIDSQLDGSISGLFA